MIAHLTALLIIISMITPCIIRNHIRSDRPSVQRPHSAINDPRNTFPPATATGASVKWVFEPRADPHRGSLAHMSKIREES
jgi:hypothetical protein